MGDGSRLRWWVLGGCAAAVLGLGTIAAAVLVAFLWWSPSASGGAESLRTSDQRPPSPFMVAGEDTPSVEQIVRARNRGLVRSAREVYSGTLTHDRDAVIESDPALTVSVPAGTFPRPEPVSVRALTLAGDVMATPPLAAWDVSIGKGGSLPRPVTLTFTHAPVPEDRPLLAARWDEDRTQWTPIPVRRVSPTVSRVETDHLSIFGLFQDLLQDGVDIWDGGLAEFDFDVYLRTRDGHFTIAIPGNAEPNLVALFAREGEPDRGSAVQKARNERLERALDDGGFTDLSQPRPARYTRHAVRRLYAAILERMLARIWRAYDGAGLRPPEHVFIMVSGVADSPQWLSRSLRHTIRVPWKQVTGPDKLAVDLAHEMLHASQSHSGLDALWMGKNRWLVEATAEYAAGRVAWQHLGQDGFRELGVVLSHAGIERRMGSGITARYLARPLMSTGRDHEYHSARFLDFLFTHFRAGGGFKGLWGLTVGAGVADGSETILGSYCARADVSLSTAYQDFADHLVLDTTFAPRVRVAAGMAATAGLASGGDREEDPRDEPITLDASSPIRTQKLLLFGSYTGDHVGFRLGSKAGEPRVLSLTLGGPGNGAHVRVYRTGAGRVDVDAVGPWERTEVPAEGRTVMVPLGTGEQAWLVATRGPRGSERLELRAELTEALAVSAKSNGNGSWRLEVETPPALRGKVRYRWELGDPGGPATRETRENVVDHAYSRPGEHEVRAILLDARDTDRVLAVAAGRVTVTSTLQLTVLDGGSDRPVPGASVRLSAEGRTATGRSNGAGVVTARDVPPRTVSFSLEVSADGYEPFAKTSSIDLSGAMVVSRSVRLRPRRDHAPEPTPRVVTRTPEPTPSPATLPPPPRPPKPRPTPVPEPTYDDAAGVAAWRAAFEAEANWSGSDASCRWTYRLEWTAAPRVQDGMVVGAYVKYVTRQCTNGPSVQDFPEVRFGDASAPPVLSSLSAIRQQYPQFWRR